MRADITRHAQVRLVASLTLSPSGFLFDSRNADSYTLNETAACLVQALMDGGAAHEIWRDLAAKFAVSEAQARRDARSFLAHLRQLDLLLAEDSDA